MKQKLFLFLFAIVVSSSVCNAQKVQSYSGSKSYTTTLGYISGTEKYSYIVDERGNKVYQGTYTFNGNKQYNDDNNKISAVYNLNANYKQGNLNGAYSVNASYDGKVWKYVKGWIPWSASAKLTASFADGKPAGTFTAVYKGDMNYHGIVTMKNGKYVGSYDYYGEGDNSLWKIKGQLSDNGKLTGSWKVHNITARQEWDMIFDNDVLISKDDKKSVTPPAVQTIAKQFAAGKLTEDQIKNQGYIIKKNTLPLDNFITYLLFLDGDDYAFGQIKGRDFSEYNSKEYWEIEKPDVLSQEGLDKIIKATINGEITEDWYNQYKYREIINGYEYSCYTNPFYNEQYNYYYLRCDPNFRDKYGYYANLDFGDVVLTPNQYKKLVFIQDSVAVAHSMVHSTTAFTSYCQNPNDVINDLLNSEQLLKEEKELLKNTFTFLSDYLLGNIFEELIEPKNRLRTARSMSQVQADTCYYVLDSLYVICRHPYGRILAFSVPMINQLNAYQKLLQKCDSIITEIAKAGDQLDADLKKQINDIRNSSFKLCLEELQKSYISTLNSSSMLQRESVIQKVAALNEQYVKILKNNTQIETSIIPPLQKDYKKLYHSLNQTPSFNTIEGVDNFANRLKNIEKIQIGFTALSDLHTNIEKNNNELKNICGKQYADVWDAYVARSQETTLITRIDTYNDLMAHQERFNNVVSEQQKNFNYINLCQKAEQLNVDILNQYGSFKNFKRLYIKLYKESPLHWDESIDNIAFVNTKVQLLSSIREQLAKQDMVAFDKQLKKVKTVEDFRQVLGL